MNRNVKRSSPTTLMLRLIAGLLLLTAGAAAGLAQARYTAVGPGTYLTVGVTASGYNSDYGKRILAGGSIFVDAHLYRRIGLEAEARDLRFHSDEDIRQRSYLIGPKISAMGRTVRPYAKLLAGRGEFTFPFKYAQGSYFALAPGAGLDWRIGSGRFLVRVVDFEYQIWPGFTYGTLKPYGASAGISWQLYSPNARPRHW